MEMRSIGIVRRVDDLGRIVIPKELRDTMDIALKDPLEIFVSGKCIILRKYQRECVFCDSTKNISYFKDVPVCESCRVAQQKDAG